MTEQEFNQAQRAGQTELVNKTIVNENKPAQNPIEEYQPYLELLRRFKKHITTAPTFTPKTFLDQIQFYDDGAGTPTRRLYLYVNKGWRYINLN